MSYTRKFIAEHLVSSKVVRDYVIGTTTAIDPLPEHRYVTFYASDREALLSDWLAVSGDICSSFNAVASQVAGDRAKSAHAEKERIKVTGTD